MSSHEVDGKTYSERNVSGWDEDFWDDPLVDPEDCED